MQPFLLTEHDNATTPDLILEWIARRSPDVVVVLRVEVSALRAAPGYTILYSDESVDWLGLARPSAEPTTATVIPRNQSYLPFQVGNRQLAERIATAMAEIPGFRDRLMLPAPLYLLKRCPARSALVALAFPERSSELGRLGDSGFREAVARALAGALIAFRRANVAPAGGSFSTETPRP
jgi:N-acetylmuramoyl-L-alanine amidase